MKGVVFLGDREIEIRQLPEPVPGPGEVVIAMKASGLCGSDLRPYRTSKERRCDPTRLKVGGHEPCGIIADVGAGVSSVKVGDRVVSITTRAAGRAKCVVSGIRRCVCSILWEHSGWRP